MELSISTLHELNRLIQRWSGVALGDDKAYLVRHRLAPLVRSLGLRSFDDLLAHLNGSGATGLQGAVVEAITIKETSFFRDNWLFNALREHILPQVSSTLKPAGASARIRIWSAGTATGQEAYSLAMIVREFIEASGKRFNESQFRVLATDISSNAIDVARTALYSSGEMERGVDESRRRRFFLKRNERWLVIDPVQHLVQFRKFNLLNSPVPLGAFDLVLCRNVLIYFDEPTRQRVCRHLFDVMQAGGWLALGSAESLYGVPTGLQTVKLGRAVLYQKSPRVK